MAVIVIICFLIIFSRLWYLQIVLGEELLKESESNRTKLIRLRAPRGSILDCKGRVLATSRPQFVVMAIPEKLKENKKSLHTLCGILNISPQELEEIIKKGHERPGSPIRVAVDVPISVVTRIAELRMKMPGVSVELDNLRNYPDGCAVAHIMGYLGEINKEQYEEALKTDRPYRLGDYIGKDGIEKQYENYLRGVDGGKQVEVNAFGRVVRELGSKPSIQGDTLKLTVDRDIQVAAERAFGNQVGAAVAINPKNGAVIAMVSSPQYDPNVFVKKINKSDWNSIILNKARPLQNRCIRNVYPPGSTFKPVVAIAGLVYHKCSLNTTVNCPGGWRFGRWFGCWKVHHSGVNFNRAIAESCNVWFYQLGHRLGIDRIANIAKQFGLGVATGIDLPNESRYDSGKLGTIPSSKWKLERYKEKWYPSETISCAIGQGYIQVSPLQMAQVAAAIANDGKIYRPHLLDEIINRHGKVIFKYKPQISHKVDADPKYFAMVREAMRLTVEQGTGRVCKMEGISVGGKTGSAQCTGSSRTHGWFICFAPVEDPQIAIAAIVEHGGHGSTSAAPVCRAMLDVFFGRKKPDEQEKQKTKKESFLIE